MNNDTAAAQGFKLADDGQWGFPEVTDQGPRCGSCRHRHANAAAVKACHEAAREVAAESAAEIWAENAWLRAAEAGSPGTWSEEWAERQSEAEGVPIPPNWHF